MPSKTKKIIVISVLSVAIIGSLVYFISKMNMKPNNFIKIGTTTENDYRLNFSPDTKNFLSALDKKVNTDNYTENFLNRFGFEIAAKNPNGPQNNSITAPSEEALVETLSREIDRSIVAGQISEKDIRITKEDTTQTATTYIKKLNAIVIRANEKSAKETQAIAENNIQEIGKTADALHTAVNDLLALEVPASWATFHMQTINFYEKKAVLLDAFANINDDPVKALVAIKELQKLGVEETQLGSLFLEKVNKIKS